MERKFRSAVPARDPRLVCTRTGTSFAQASLRLRRPVEMSMKGLLKFAGCVVIVLIVLGLLVLFGVLDLIF